MCLSRLNLVTLSCPCCCARLPDLRLVVVVTLPIRNDLSVFTVMFPSSIASNCCLVSVSATSCLPRVSLTIQSCHACVQQLVWCQHYCCQPVVPCTMVSLLEFLLLHAPNTARPEPGDDNYFGDGSAADTVTDQESTPMLSSSKELNKARPPATRSRTGRRAPGAIRKSREVKLCSTCNTAITRIDGKCSGCKAQKSSQCHGNMRPSRSARLMSSEKLVQQLCSDRKSHV